MNYGQNVLPACLFSSFCHLWDFLCDWVPDALYRYFFKKHICICFLDWFHINSEHWNLVHDSGECFLSAWLVLPFSFSAFAYPTGTRNELPEVGSSIALWGSSKALHYWKRPLFALIDLGHPSVQMNRIFIELVFFKSYPLLPPLPHFSFDRSSQLLKFLTLRKRGHFKKNSVCD